MNKDYTLNANGYSMPVTSKHDLKESIEAMLSMFIDYTHQPTLTVKEKEAGVYGVRATTTHDFDGVYRIHEGYGVVSGRYGYKTKKFFVFDGVLYSEQLLTNHLHEHGFGIGDFFS